MLTQARRESVVFDAVYVAKLRSGEQQTANHFARYFGSLLKVKLRKRLPKSDSAEDVAQETIRRVLESVIRGDLKNPERFPGFVNAVCNNVLREFWRSNGRYVGMEDVPEPADTNPGPQRKLERAERLRHFHINFLKLCRRDRELLQLMYWDERHNEELCSVACVNRDYLRVLLHRAKRRLRTFLEEESSGEWIL